MFKFIHRLLTMPIYVQNDRPCCGEPPDFLTLREIADIPPYHPPRNAGGRSRPGARAKSDRKTRLL